MKCIKFISKVMEGNIHEARKYAEKIEEYAESNSSIAEWCEDMAKAHLQFNETGHDIVKEIIKEYESNGTKNEMSTGMMVIYEDKHKDMIRETAEIKALLEMYK